MCMCVCLRERERETSLSIHLSTDTLGCSPILVTVNSAATKRCMYLSELKLSLNICPGSRLSLQVLSHWRGWERIRNGVQGREIVET